LRATPGLDDMERYFFGRNGLLGRLLQQTQQQKMRNRNMLVPKAL